MEPAKQEDDLYTQFSRIDIKIISAQSVRVMDTIGAGEFGTVSKGEWQGPGGPVEVAVKTLRSRSSEADRVKFLQEAAIMGQFHHPNVVRLYGVSITDDPKMLILELLPVGDLRQYLVSMRPTDKQVDAEMPAILLSYCRQIAFGVTYLAAKDFVHRDLAARNILVSEDGTCKIADFGMARDLVEADYYKSRGGKVPVKWTAPEALHYNKYSTASDVWSYGAVMYEIWSLGHKPFQEYNNTETLQMITDGYRLPPPPGTPRPIYQIMIECWHPEAEQRPTAVKIVMDLQHPDFQLLKWSTEAVEELDTEARILGAELKAGTNLHKDLQTMYLHSE